MSQHIGIVACSAEGAALCYRTICAEGASLMGEWDHPEVSMHTFSLRTYMDALNADKWDEVAKLMIGSVNKLAAIGADFAICPDNTIHQAFDSVTAKSKIPWLHIAKEVAKVAVERGYKKLGVLGTRYLMEGPVYPSTLNKLGIESQTPDSTARQRISTEIPLLVSQEDSVLPVLDSTRILARAALAKATMAQPAERH